MELEAKEEKGQSPFPAPETRTSLASGQSSPGHKLSVTPSPPEPWLCQSLPCWTVHTKTSRSQ